MEEQDLHHRGQHVSIFSDKNKFTVTIGPYLFIYYIYICIIFGFWKGFSMPLSTILRSYRGGQFYWARGNRSALRIRPGWHAYCSLTHSTLLIFHLSTLFPHWCEGRPSDITDLSNTFEALNSMPVVFRWSFQGFFRIQPCAEIWWHFGPGGHIDCRGQS